MKLLSRFWTSLTSLTNASVSEGRRQFAVSPSIAGPPHARTHRIPPPAAIVFCNTIGPDVPVRLFFLRCDAKADEVLRRIPKMAERNGTSRQGDLVMYRLRSAALPALFIATLGTTAALWWGPEPPAA